MTTNDPTLPYQSFPPELLPEDPPPPKHDPYGAIRIANYRNYFIGNACATLGQQMAGVTIAWEIYVRTESAAALGMVGLVQIIPILLFALPAGHLVDRVNRKSLLLCTSAILILTYAMMGFASAFSGHLPMGGILGQMNVGVAWVAGLFGDVRGHFTDPYVPILFTLLLLNGCVRSVNQPAKQSIIPLLVPTALMANAFTWNASIFETCAMGGPTLAGLWMTYMGGEVKGNMWPYAEIYWMCAACNGVQLVNLLLVHLGKSGGGKEPLTVKSLLAGVHFVWSNKVILSVITLDMFAVLLGGATALLPIFAKDILHVGALGFTVLRAAPSVGAIGMAVVLAHLPPMKNAGRNLLWCVAGFGVATIVFGLSQWFWLSLVALVLTGVFDNISVVVRHTLVQVLTPDHMRGRVSAVNSVFISSSNELGEFESGATASVGIRLWGAVKGPMIAAAAGGVGTLLVVGAIALVFPEVRRVKRLTHGGK